MKFKEWLKLREVETSTASIATFAMPVFGGPFRRMYPEPVEADPCFKKKKKKKRHGHAHEG